MTDKEKAIRHLMDGLSRVAPLINERCSYITL